MAYLSIPALALLAGLLAADLAITDGGVKLPHTALPEHAVEPKSGLALISIPGGSFHFQRGAPVEIRSFDLASTPVTTAAYGRCVVAGVCTEPATRGACNWSSPRLDHPINCVNWSQAFAYCRWMGGRLPTEEEREYSAAGGDEERDYPWGNELPANRACWNGEGNGAAGGKHTTTCATGAHASGDSRWGLHDMAGNVWEWTATHDPETGEKIVRGGSWLYDRPQGLRARARALFDAAYQSDYIGFRCAR